MQESSAQEFLATVKNLIEQILCALSNGISAFWKYMHSIGISASCVANAGTIERDKMEKGPSLLEFTT